MYGLLFKISIRRCRYALCLIKNIRIAPNKLCLFCITLDQSMLVKAMQSNNFNLPYSHSTAKFERQLFCHISHIGSHITRNIIIITTRKRRCLREILKVLPRIVFFKFPCFDLRISIFDEVLFFILVCLFEIRTPMHILFGIIFLISTQIFPKVALLKMLIFRKNFKLVIYLIN